MGCKTFPWKMGVFGYNIENVSQVQDNNGEWRPIDSDVIILSRVALAR